MTDVAGDGFDIINKARHYNMHPSGYECIDIIRRLSLCLGNAVKYVWREDLKGGRQDYLEAEYFLKDLSDNCPSEATHVPPAQVEMLLEVAASEERQTGPSAPLRGAYFQAIAFRDITGALTHLRELLALAASDTDEVS